jgi:hypothetical protein
MAASGEQSSMIATDPVWLGAEQLRQFLVPISEIEHHPDNPRRGDVPVVAESLSLFGQLKPIILHTYAGQSVPFIVAGNHTTRGATHERNAWSHIAAVTPELTDEEADKFLLMDNRSSDLASNDEAVLAVMLQRMMDAGQLEGTGYSADDVDDLLSSMDSVATVEEGEFQGDYAENPAETAERFTAPGEGVKMKEALLMYPEAQFEKFTGMLTKLREEWGIENGRDIVYEAVKRAHDNV